ncbi:hypothetical protein L486_03722 [Kwoniella mangroviensis CBS 10435]|uniref:Uncharacterized protein n=2 Tax=Kwoniella mangrovensis TaxID=463800 RepID=A0A1B9IUP0_9TREE|nr:hypothetical protein L486_03722 [Kwoniella mangroviensis CBS 10435]
MPSPPSQNPPVLESNNNVVQTTATAQQNTRALLRSLEELRDSLSTRVEHLSNAVERLRGQAGELERALEGENGVQRELRDPTRSRQRARDIVNAYENRENPSPVPPPAPASLTATAATTSTPISRSLSRHITSDEIHTLLNRASASAPGSASRPNPANDVWITRAQNIEERIRRLSETARDLRSRSTSSINEGNTERDRPDDLLRGVLNRARELREDQDRLEDGIRRLSIPSPEDGDGRARTPQIVYPNLNRRQSRQGTTGMMSMSRSRSRGLTPTNIRQVERQPPPEIVRSAPVSPAYTIRPSLDSTSCTDVAASPGPASDGNYRSDNHISPLPLPQQDSRLITNRINILNQPVPPRPSTRLSNTDLMDMARIIVEGISTSSLTDHNPPSTTNNNITPLHRRNARRDSSLTFRGRRVEASMAQNQGQGGTQPRSRNDDEEMTEDEVLRTWPFLAQILQHPFTATRTTTTANGQSNRTGASTAQSSRGESPMEETVRLMLDDRERRDRYRSPRPAGSSASNIGENERGHRRRNTGQWSSSWSARDPDTEDDQDGRQLFEEHTVVVIDMTTDPPTEQVLPRFLVTQPQRRSTEEQERIRDDRRLANERVWESRRELESMGITDRPSAPRSRANPPQPRQRDRGRLTSTSSSGLGLGLGLEPALGVEAVTPTQGISMADLENGMEGVMRALIIDSDSEDETTDDSESDNLSESGSGSGEGTVFEGEGERVERGSNHGQSTNNTRAADPINTIIDQIIPPKESFDTDLHLWPSHYNLVSAGI